MAEIGECPVCFGVLNECNNAQLNCKHPLCINCLTQLHENVCPICRVKLSTSLPNINRYLSIINDDDFSLNESFDEVEEEDGWCVEIFTLKHIIGLFFAFFNTVCIIGTLILENTRAIVDNIYLSILAFQSISLLFTLLIVFLFFVKFPR